MKKEVKESKASKSARSDDWIERESASIAAAELSLGLPLHVFLGEVIDVAKFVTTYWEPVEDGVANRPGLRSAKKTGALGFDKDIADELVELHALAQQAQTAVLLTAKIPESAEPIVAKGRDLLDSITAALEWCFDDGVEDDKDAQLSAVQASHEDTASIDMLAAALVDYAGLAEKYADELEGLIDFEKGHIDEARKVSAQLTGIAPKLGTDPETAAALARRNKLVTMLHRRVLRVRKAARLVFRRFPSISQQATSAYQRRSRAALRRREAPAPEKT